MRGVLVVLWSGLALALTRQATRRTRQGRAGSLLQARRPQTADEWREHRRKSSPRASKAVESAEDALAARWAVAVGASASALGGLGSVRKAEFLQAWALENPAEPSSEAVERVADAPSGEVDVTWERRVQFEALRDGNALRQQDVLGEALRREG